MSEAVEKRIWEILDHPTVSPYGNPIPGLDSLGVEGSEDMATMPTLGRIAARLQDAPVRVQVRRIDEPLQTEHGVMAALRRAGALPGATVKVTRSPGGVLIGSGGEYAELPLGVAEHIAVEPV